MANLVRSYCRVIGDRSFGRAGEQDRSPLPVLPRKVRFLSLTTPWWSLLECADAHVQASFPMSYFYRWRDVGFIRRAFCDREGMRGVVS